MQLGKFDNTSFGKIAFIDKSTEKLFLEKLDDIQAMGSREKFFVASRRAYCKQMINVENNIQDRVLEIGLKKVNDKDIFTCNDIAYGMNKRGSQSIYDFLVKLFADVK